MIDHKTSLGKPLDDEVGDILIVFNQEESHAVLRGKTGLLPARKISQAGEIILKDESLLRPAQGPGRMEDGEPQLTKKPPERSTVPAA